MEYCHFPSLGIPSANREKISSLVQYKALFASYKESVAIYQEELREVAELLTDMPSVLVCQEADPMFCHRSVLAVVLTDIVNLPIQHLAWPR
jgi:uncharacterized protein (DUF488 family)